MIPHGESLGFNTLLSRHMKKLIFFIVPLLLLSGPAWSADQKTRAALEKTYRTLVKAIHDRKFDTLLAIVHPDGIGGSDFTTSKDKLEKDLKDSNSYLQKVLYEGPNGIAEDLCEEQGRAPLSTSAFYKMFGDKYRISISELKKNEFYSIGALGKAGKDKQACEYFLLGMTFMKHKSGKYYLVSNFR